MVIISAHPATLEGLQGASKLMWMWLRQSWRIFVCLTIAWKVAMGYCYLFLWRHCWGGMGSCGYCCLRLGLGPFSECIHPFVLNFLPAIHCWCHWCYFKRASRAVITVQLTRNTERLYCLDVNFKWQRALFVPFENVWMIAAVNGIWVQITSLPFLIHSSMFWLIGEIQCHVAGKLPLSCTLFTFRVCQHAVISALFALLAVNKS